MAGKRKHISLKTKLAATLRALGHVSYKHAKMMSEDQIISLYHFDHNILHETGHEDRDKFWNLRPMLILEHRAKSKLDAKVIAKGRRIREAAYAWLELTTAARGRPKIQSRGFDKRYRRKMDGTVVKR